MDMKEKQRIRSSIEIALNSYYNFKRDRSSVDQLSLPYLTLLEEVDAVDGYLNALRSLRFTKELHVLELYLRGHTVDNIVALVAEEKTSYQDVRVYLFGSDKANGFIPTMYVKILDLCEYCPFCDDSYIENSNFRGGPYPLSQKLCPHKELLWREEE